jgi:hypothetical protein
MSSPPAEIGVDEPMFVNGAMAATSEAMARKTPAEAAREPGGETYTITGTGDSSMLLIMLRIELSSPPGVSSRTTAAS